MRSSYKLRAAIYDTNNRVDKLMKKDLLIVVKEAAHKSSRTDFIEMG